MAATKAANPSVPAHLNNNPDALFYRLQRFYQELNLRKGGTPYHPNFLSDNVPVSELAIDVVVLGRAFVEAMEKGISEGKYRV